MKTKLYLLIILRILILGIAATLFSYVPEHARHFFNDTKKSEEVIKQYVLFGEDCWIWGIRHFIYCWVMSLIMIASGVDAVIFTIRKIWEYYPSVKP